MGLEERFWSKVDIKEEEECWEWNAGLFRAGYGSFRYGDRKITSSRMVWFLIYGEFPELFVLHKCDNRKCCNPNHLFLGTNKDNSLDMVSKGRNAYRKGESNLNASLKEKDVIYIRKTKDDKFTLAKKFNVTERTIRDVRKNRTWNHI